MGTRRTAADRHYGGSRARPTAARTTARARLAGAGSRGKNPDVTPQKFRLDVDGAVEHRLSLNLDEYMALPQSDSVSDIHCVTQWSRYDNHWKGVAAQALLKIVQPGPDARHVMFHSFDGYTTNVPLEQFDQPDVFLVHEWEGRPLSRAHGGGADTDPATVFWKSAKWLRRIQFTLIDRQDFGNSAAIIIMATRGWRSAMDC